LYVVINKGFTIYVAELERDLLTIKPNTATPCIRPKQRWERMEGKVNEGPSVIKHKGRYFLLYSGNGYKSQKYGIGCAVADDIRGVWKKLPDNPIFQLPSGLYGTGHGAPFYDKRGNMHYVFHAHNSSEKVHPRCMYISRASIKGGKRGERIAISSKYITPKKIK
jgi:GH43 family beta-xylosidase